jgi:nucleoside-diphosphate-sugar epimerase
MDSSRIHAMGWTAKTSLEEALRASYQAYVKTVEN